MKTKDIAESLAQIINECDKSDGIIATVNPIAAFAPTNYVMASPDGVILIYLDNIRGFDYGKQLIDKRIPSLTSYCKFVVSVGVRSADKLDEYCEMITECLTYEALSKEVKEVLPSAWSRMSKSEDAYWRQLWFDARVERII